MIRQMARNQSQCVQRQGLQCCDRHRNVAVMNWIKHAPHNADASQRLVPHFQTCRLHCILLCHSPRSLLPDMPITEDDVFLGRQPLQSDWTARMQFVG